jgi:hypothetical protein
MEILIARFWRHSDVQRELSNFSRNSVRPSIERQNQRSSPLARIRDIPAPEPESCAELQFSEKTTTDCLGWHPERSRHSMVVESCGTKDPGLHLMSSGDDFTHSQFCRWISAKNESPSVNGRHVQRSLNLVS